MMTKMTTRTRRPDRVDYLGVALAPRVSVAQAADCLALRAQRDQVAGSQAGQVRAVPGVCQDDLADLEQMKKMTISTDRLVRAGGCLAQIVLGACQDRQRHVRGADCLDLLASLDLSVDRAACPVRDQGRDPVQLTMKTWKMSRPHDRADCQAAALERPV
jgi:hypothetical protein